MPGRITESWIADADIRPLVFDAALIPTLQKSADFFHHYNVLPQTVEVSSAFDFSLSAGANQIAKQSQGE
jgi:sulfonate transport system substrate-binding protein